MRQEIVAWLKTVRLRDYPMNQAKARLLEKGFEEAEIDAAINHITQEGAAEKPNGQPLYLVLAVTAIIVIIVIVLASL